MEKSEYRNKIEEMRELIACDRIDDALNIADSINWRKVHNVNSLVDVSEIYEVGGELEDARSLLLLAHSRSPIGRMIIFRLAMISIKLEDFESAVDFYNKFVDIAPHDSLKYIIKYNLFVAQGADDMTVIEVLEQLKEADFMEEWAYELAYLYHRNGLADKCIDLCDEIILWFSDGPYVERALELKMLYQPLDKGQENKYRHFQQRKDGITEIMANEELLSGEIVPHTVAIPNIELTEEKYNTINLQAEIKKNIDEIMKATEAGEVVENMDAINRLVEEIPYLQVKDVEEETDDFEEPEEEETSINEVFLEYLKVERDGQLSFLIPENTPEDADEPMEGQITIDDIIADWEKTKRAAEQALEDAERKKLEQTKAAAIKEANQVLNRLEEAIPKFDAGMTSSDLLKEEYLKGLPLSDKKPESRDRDVFVIPSVNNDTNGREIPVIHSQEIHHEPKTGVVNHSVSMNTTSWMPPVLSEPEEEDISLNLADSVLEIMADKELPDIEVTNPVAETMDKKAAKSNYEMASQLLADLNDMLQQEIDKYTAEDEELENEIAQLTQQRPVEVAEPAVDEAMAIADRISKEKDINYQVEQLVSSMVPPTLEIIDDYAESDNLSKSAEATEVPEQKASDLLNKLYEQQEVEEEIPTQLSIEEIGEEETEESMEEILYQESVIDDMEDTDEAIESEESVEPETIEIVKEQIDDIAEEELVEESTEKTPALAEHPIYDFSEDDLEPFSYFVPVSDLRQQLVEALSGTLYYYTDEEKRHGGNLIIEGEGGTGKTKIATAYIEVLQNCGDILEGGIGRIDGDKLNNKNLQELFKKMEGGSLIIEKAGQISAETAVVLALLLDSDKSGILVILEDNAEGIQEALLKDGRFAKKFTEKIVMPNLTINELVGFAEIYAYDNGFVMDDMGRLALYNRVNQLDRYNHNTSIEEVADIMDEAMDQGEKISLFKKHKKDSEGNIILVEKDFERK